MVPRGASWCRATSTGAIYSEQIQHAASFDEPQRRIGELLVALREEWVPSELIGVVASKRSGAVPDAVRQGTRPRQTACSRPRPALLTLPRAAWIARRMLVPAARATGGGKAFPIWRYAAVLRP